MAAVAPAASSSKTIFQETMERHDLQKQDMNRVVMDFLIKEGYPSAAASFAEEANIDLRDDETLMAERVEIREAILRGGVQEAIEQINEINPQLLDNDKPLHFSLLRLQLIEHIKEIFTAPESQKPAMVTTAISFAQQNLAPYAPQNERFKIDLERAMALMIVPKEAWSSPTSQSRSDQASAFGHFWELIDPSLRVEIAINVNMAILRSQGVSDRSRIKKMLQTRAWAEDLAKEKGIDLPDLTISLSDTAPQNGHGTSGDGGGDTQMTEDDVNTSQRYSDAQATTSQR